MVNLQACKLGRIIWISIGNVVNGILLISIIPIIYTFIRNRVRNKIKTPRLLFYPGLLLLVVTFLLLALNLTIGVYFCDTNQAIYQLLLVPFSQLYGTQFYLLMLSLFLRLQYVLNGTLQAFSRLTLSIMTIIFILLPVMSVIAGIMYHDPNGRFMVFGAFVIALALIISILFMYIRKLLAIYKNIDSDPKLIEIITKTTILTLISISATFLTSMCITMKPIMSEFMDFQVIETFILYIDVYTNFLCVVLTYRYFDKYYSLLCKGMHSKCESMWFRIAKLRMRPSFSDTSITNDSMIKV